MLCNIPQAWTWSAYLRRICGYRDILAYNGTEPPARMMITTETDMDFFYFEIFFSKSFFNTVDEISRDIAVQLFYDRVAMYMCALFGNVNDPVSPQH